MLLKPSRYERDLEKHERRLARAKAKRTAKRVEVDAFAQLRRLVYLRDRATCRVFGTPLKLVSANPLEVAHCHHVIFRSAGGSDALENLALLSPRAHDLVHRHVIDVTGDANKTLTILERNPETGRVVHEWTSPCPS